MSNNVKKILVAGTGYMAKEYINVLKDMHTDYIVVGNRKESVDQFCKDTGEEAFAGGVGQYLLSGGELPEYAIVAVSTGALFEVTKALAETGVKNILVEKPGVTSKHEMNELLRIADRNKNKIYVAYNRRFYQSVRKVKELIEEDGGLHALTFEFTEWAHVIEKTNHSLEMKQKWFLLNSTHVVDLAFYLAGQPKVLNAQIAGRLDWHEAGSIYTGCGITEKEIPFVYSADWGAPGRWAMELLTAKHRFYLKPLEKIQIQNIGSVKVEEYTIDDAIDQKYKAGLYEEVGAFLSEDPAGVGMCTLKEHSSSLEIYQKMSGEVY